MRNINIEDFKFSMPLALRWNDMDALGHVNNIYYFEYFQIARGPYMDTVSPQWDWEKDMFVIAHIECDYFREITLYTPNVKGSLRVSSISTKSFDMEYLITSTNNEGKEKIHARGKSVNVMIDMEAKKSITLPEWLKTDLINYEPALDINL